MAEHSGPGLRKSSNEFHLGHYTVAMKKHVKPHLRALFMHAWMVSKLYYTKGSRSVPEGGLFWRVHSTKSTKRQKKSFFVENKRNSPLEITFSKNIGK